MEKNQNHKARRLSDYCTPVFANSHLTAFPEVRCAFLRELREGVKLDHLEGGKDRGPPHTLVAQYAVFNTSDKTKAFVFCNGAPAEVKSSCFESIGKTFRQLNIDSEERKTMCSTVEPLYRKLCSGIES